MTDFIYPSPLTAYESRWRTIKRLTELHHDIQMCIDRIDMVQKIKGLPLTDPQRVFYVEAELNDTIRLYRERRERYEKEWNGLMDKSKIK